MNSFKILAIAMMMALMPAFMQCDQPTYQVSLYVKMHPKVPPIHLCNGVIIQSRLILTTASCIHYQFSATSSVVSLPPTSLSVIAGSSTAFADELILDVKDVLVAHHFNYTTGENDLALLRLNGKLPLDIRNDMSWITLEDASIFEGPCVANYYVRSSIPNGPNYIQTEELPLLEKEMCRANYDYPNSRKNDICSLYMLPFGFDCHSVDALLSHNGDRGTGLVCDNRLVGLLSMILPPEEDNSELGCSDKPINAFYTNLAPYLGWIYDKVSDEDISMYDDGEFVISVPYSGTNEDSMVSTESGSASSVTANNATSSSEHPTAERSTAVKLIYGWFSLVGVTIYLSFQRIVLG